MDSLHSSRGLSVGKARVTSKGQVTIPKAVRDRLGIRPGDEIEFVEDEAGVRVQKRLLTSPFARYRGYLKHLAGRDPDALVEEMRGR
ncbi:MAG: AbrB/MazE/SpoVT family DNA-binding domain-containing protein [Chloroflexi bacterium]|nr:AbrB/MazE/SpoVT family DNA-binding domain-containing protein [Chloroflexota bacterium]